MHCKILQNHTVFSKPQTMFKYNCQMLIFIIHFPESLEYPNAQENTFQSTLKTIFFNFRAFFYFCTLYVLMVLLFLELGRALCFWYFIKSKRAVLTEFKNFSPFNVTSCPQYLSDLKVVGKRVPPDLRSLVTFHPK